MFGTHGRLESSFGRTLWKGPRICSPAYDLKLRFTKCVIIRRGAPGSLVIAGGGGGGMLPRISSKLRLSTASAASPSAESVAQKRALFSFSVRIASGGEGGGGNRDGTVAHGGGVGENKNKQTKTQSASRTDRQATPGKVDRRRFFPPLFRKQEWSLGSDMNEHTSVLTNAVSLRFDAPRTPPG